MIEITVEQRKGLEVLDVHQLSARQTGPEEVIGETRICYKNVLVDDLLLHIRDAYRRKIHIVIENAIFETLITQDNGRHLEAKVEVKNATEMIAHVSSAIRYIGTDNKYPPLW